MPQGGNRTLVVGVYGHGGAGKTTLVEALLQDAGALQRRGRLEEGPQFLDHEPEAKRHRMSVHVNVAFCRYGQDRLYFLDTPGYPDFVAECAAVDEVIDVALLVVDATAGVEVGTEQHAERLLARGVPLVVAVTKQDRERASFAEALAGLAGLLPGRLQPLYRPVEEAARFGDLVPSFPGYAPLVETVVEGDDALLERYLEGAPLDREVFLAALLRAVRGGRLVPAIPVSGFSGVGVRELAELLLGLTVPPSPGLPVLRVFKTLVDPTIGRLSLFRVEAGVLTADTVLRHVESGRQERFGQLFRLQGAQREPATELQAGEVGGVAKLQEGRTGDLWAASVPEGTRVGISLPPANYRMVVRPASQGDEDRLTTVLQRQLEEDPGLTLLRSGRELLLSGYGDLQFEVLAERLRRKFHVDVRLSLPAVPYLETIRATVKVEGKYKKQTGGHGQYGHVWLELGPSEEEFEFVDKIFGGAVPLQYRPAVEKGVREAMQEGVLAGYPLTNVRCVLFDGSSHPVDSSELAFKIAGAMALKKGAKEARPVLLEPIHELTVVVPKGYTGEVLGDLGRRRGRIAGIESEGRREIVHAYVPLAEILRYAVELRSLTGGRASYTERFSHYEEVPAPLAEGIVARRQAESGGARPHAM